MASTILTITAVESGFGFLLTSAVLYLVLRRGRRTYHYLFAAFMLICAIWDLGVFLLMIRNEHVEELELIGRAAILPCTFIPALIFHFVSLYTRRPIKWAIALMWGLIGASWTLILAGLFYQIEGYYVYEWGNMFKVQPSVLDPLVFIFWFGANLTSCWLLYKSAKRAEALERRHTLYILAGFLAVTFTIVKALVTMGVDAPILLPLGMFLSDIFVSIIGLAIIKERLFDITVIVKKGTLYTILAGTLIFIYSFLEHILITYIGERIGEHSNYVHLVAVGVGIAVLMPLKSRIERGVERYFEHKKLAF